MEQRQLTAQDLGGGGEGVIEKKGKCRLFFQENLGDS